MVAFRPSSAVRMEAFLRHKTFVVPTLTFLANAESHFETPLQRSVLVESLEGLHAQVTMAGVGASGQAAACSAIAIAKERVQMLAALKVRLAIA